MAIRHSKIKTEIKIEDQIVNLYAQGATMDQIKKKARVGYIRIQKVIKERPLDIVKRKEQLRDKFAKLADAGVDRLNTLMAEDKLKGFMLMNTTGMAVDKLIDLTPTETPLPELHEHIHRHLHVDQSVLSDAAKKLIQAQVVEVDQ